MRKYRFFIVSALMGLFVTGSMCLAGQYDLKKITPEIDAALKGRQARYGQLQVLKREGLVGENSRGYVADLKSDAAAGRLVAQENRDRGIIYRALVDQNALGPNGMREVENVFADVQRDKAAPGEMIQSPSGSWERK